MKLSNIKIKKSSFLFSITMLILASVCFFSWLIYLNQKNISNINPEFQKHYDQFLIESSKRGLSFKSKKVDINFNDLNEYRFNPDELAKCVYFPHPHIVINKEKYKSQPLHIQEATLFHELIHCVWIKPHVKIYPHIMNEYTDPNIFMLYSNYREQMLNQLFDKKSYTNSDYLRDYLTSLKEAFSTYGLFIVLLAGFLLILRDLLLKITNSFYKKKEFIP